MLDTNVYASAFLFPARPVCQIWQAATRGYDQLLTSPAIVREIASVLREDFAWEDSRVIRQLKLIAKTAEIVAPRGTLEVIQEDPDGERHSSDEFCYCVEIFQDIS